MTGTPLDLTPFGGVLTAIGWLYWLIALALVVLALWLPKRPWQKLTATGIALLAVYFVFMRPVQMRVQEQHQQRQEATGKLEESMALFKKRCETAGEKITRTVENVDGVVWMKWREKISNADNFADQFKLNDPYGQDCGAEDCVASLLRVTAGATLNPEEAKRHGTGYRFVETTDPRDGLRYRYTARLEQGWNPEAIDRYKKEKGGELPSYSYQFKMSRVPIEKYSAGYGATWDDISTREDREHWIAGGSMKVIDLRTNEVVAERLGYMVDQGQGSQAGFRSPWLYAEYTACPAFDRSESNSPIKSSRSRAFVFKVLNANKGE